jgi:hypothetical protein
MSEITKESIKYELEELKKGLDKCDKNIKIFEEAIKAEEATKRNFRRIIATLEDDIASKK